MLEITNSKLILDVTGGKCYSQTISIKGNDFTISVGSCEV